MPLINLFKKPRSADTSNDEATTVSVETSVTSLSTVDTESEQTVNKASNQITEAMNRSLMGKVWHAFTALPQNENGGLDSAKAKVLTQSLASVMQISTAIIKDFDEFFPKPEDDHPVGIEFEQFRNFLSAHLLTKVIIDNHEEEACFDTDQDATPEATVKAPAVHEPINPASGKKPISWDFLDQVCWTLYWKQALSPKYEEALSTDALYSLWLWFTTFADTDDSGVVICPVRMDGDELNYWMQYLFGELLALEYQPLEFTQVVNLSFTEILDAILTLKEEWSIEKEEMQFVINEFRMEIIDGILKKGQQSTRGFLYKGKRNLMKSQWKRRYCVLTLKTFSYYADENMTDKKGQIPLSQIMSADPYRDRNSKLTRYQMETNTALFILEAEDLRSRNQWIRDIRYAIRCNQKMVENVHTIKSEKRKKERAEFREKQRLAEEEKLRFNKRIQEAEEVNQELNIIIKNVKSELEREEQQRIAEEKAREQITKDLQERLKTVAEEMNASLEKIGKEKDEQQQALEAERNRVAELQTIRQELQMALEEEQRLRKDEELVMRMQAELVEEKIKAHERLEEMKNEQEQLLEAEIQRRTTIQVELDEQKEMIAKSEFQIQQYTDKLKDSETQKSELYKKMKTLELKMDNMVHPMEVNSHRGKGAFPTLWGKKKKDTDEDQQSI